MLDNQGEFRDQQLTEIVDRKRTAIVGTGGRYAMYLRSIIKDYNDRAEVVGLCDINSHRLRVASELIVKYGGQAVPTYAADQFEQMIAATSPDIVIVTSIDRTHHRYMVAAMESGRDVICENPMTIDAVKYQSILDAIKRTGRELRVTFLKTCSRLAETIRWEDLQIILTEKIPF